MLRGGSRQKLATLAAMSGATRSKSKLANALLRLFGWGLLTATSVQWIAQAAMDDGLSHPDLEELAGIGRSGEFAGNCRRDLLRAFRPQAWLAKLSSLWLPLKDKNGLVEIQQVLVHAPSRFFQSLWNRSHSLFHRACGSGGNCLREFWMAVNAHDPKLRKLESMMGPRESWCDHTIPYKLHGDGAQFTSKPRFHDDLPDQAAARYSRRFWANGCCSGQWRSLRQCTASIAMRTHPSCCGL